MKKLLVLTLGLATSLAMANTQSPVVTEAAKQPILHYGVFDVSSKVPRPMKNHQYSVSNANHQFCWSVQNVNFIAKNEVIEVFQSPDTAKFLAPGTSIVTANDGKLHKVTSYLPAQNNEFVGKCWKFDDKDPKGVYTFEIFVNGATFPAQQFEVVK